LSDRTRYTGLVTGFTNSGEQILAISIYCESCDISQKSFGKCAKVYPGKAPLQEILQAEVAGDHIKKPVDNVDWDAKTPIGGGNLNLGGRIGEKANYLSQVSCPVYFSGYTNR